MTEADETTSTRFLNSRPGLRERIRSSDEFQKWRAAYRRLDVDGTVYFVASGTPMVSGGDRLMDEDELMLEWARLVGIVGRTEHEGR